MGPADAPATPPDARKQLGSLPQAVILLAPGQRISTANPAAEQFLGQSQRRLLGRLLSEVLALDPHLVERLTDTDAPVTARHVDAIVVGQGPRRIDIATAPVVDAPGWQVFTMADSGAVEPLGQASQTGENALLRGPEVLAHEIKNPLAGIKGAAQLLGRKVEGADRALTTLIADEVDRIAKLIDQMQTLSRRTTEPVGPCNLHETIRRASTILAAGGTGALIEEEFDPSLPPVLGSADALVQVLLNLLANAREATGTLENPRIIVRTRFVSGLQLHAPDKGKSVRLPIEVRVSDNGAGVDMAMRDHIFEPFVTSKKSGQGLGLALVRKLVRDMNGRITYDRDEAGGWTHFRVHLPMAMEGKPPRRAARNASKTV